MKKYNNLATIFAFSIFSSAARSTNCDEYFRGSCQTLNCRLIKTSDSRSRLQLIEDAAETYVQKLSTKATFEIFVDDKDLFQLTDSEKIYFKTLIKSGRKSHANSALSADPNPDAGLGARPQSQKMTVHSEIKIPGESSLLFPALHVPIKGSDTLAFLYPRYSEIMYDKSHQIIQSLVIEKHDGTLLNYPVPTSLAMTSVTAIHELPGGAVLLECNSEGKSKIFQIPTDFKAEPVELLAANEIKSFGKNTANLVYKVKAKNVSLFYIAEGIGKNVSLHSIDLPSDSIFVADESAAKLTPLFYSKTQNSFFRFSEEGQLTTVKNAVPVKDEVIGHASLSDNRVLFYAFIKNPFKLPPQPARTHNPSVYLLAEAPGGSRLSIFDPELNHSYELKLKAPPNAYYSYAVRGNLPNGDTLLAFVLTEVEDKKIINRTLEWYLLPKNSQKLTFLVSDTPSNVKTYFADNRLHFWRVPNSQALTSTEPQSLVLDLKTLKTRETETPEGLNPLEDGHYWNAGGVFRFNAKKGEFENIIEADTYSVTSTSINESLSLVVLTAKNPDRNYLYLSSAIDPQVQPHLVNVGLTRKGWAIAESYMDDLGNGKALLAVAGRSNQTPQQTTFDSFVFDLKSGNLTPSFSYFEERSSTQTQKERTWNIIPKTGMFFSLHNRRMKLYKLDAKNQSVEIEVSGISADTEIFDAFSTHNGNESRLHISTAKGVRLLTIPNRY